MSKKRFWHPILAVGTLCLLIAVIWDVSHAQVTLTPADLASKPTPASTGNSFSVDVNLSGGKYVDPAGVEYTMDIPKFTVTGTLTPASPPGGAASFDAARVTASNYTFSTDKLTATVASGKPAGHYTAFTAPLKSSGKNTFAMTPNYSTTSNGDTAVGLASIASSSAVGNWLGAAVDSVGIYPSGQVWVGGKSVGLAITYKKGDKVGVQVDLTGKTIAVSVNGGAWSNPVSIAAMSTFSLSPAVTLYGAGDSAVFSGSGGGTCSGCVSWN